MRTYTPLAPVVAGLVLLALGRLVQRILPVLGRMAYQAAAAGSYTPADYRVSLGGYYIIALALIVLGVVLFVIDRRRA